MLLAETLKNWASGSFQGSGQDLSSPLHSEADLQAYQKVPRKQCKAARRGSAGRLPQHPQLRAAVSSSNARCWHQAAPLTALQAAPEAVTGMSLPSERVAEQIPSRSRLVVYSKGLALHCTLLCVGTHRSSLPLSWAHPKTPTSTAGPAAPSHGHQRTQQSCRGSSHSQWPKALGHDHNAKRICHHPCWWSGDPSGLWDPYKHPESAHGF